MLTDMLAAGNNAHRSAVEADIVVTSFAANNGGASNSSSVLVGVASPKPARDVAGAEHQGHSTMTGFH